MRTTICHRSDAQNKTASNNGSFIGISVNVNYISFRWNVLSILLRKWCNHDKICIIKKLLLNLRIIIFKFNTYLYVHRNSLCNQYLKIRRSTRPRPNIKRAIRMYNARDCSFTYRTIQRHTMDRNYNYWVDKINYGTNP